MLYLSRCSVDHNYCYEVVLQTKVTLAVLWLSIWPLDVSHDSLPNYLPRVSIVCFTWGTLDFRSPQRGKKYKGGSWVRWDWGPRVLMSQEQNHPATAMDLHAVGVHRVFISIRCCFLVDIESLIGRNEGCFKKSSLFRTGDQQTEIHLVWLYFHHTHLSLPPVLVHIHSRSPVPGSGASCRFELTLFPITFGKAGNVASLYVALGSALISEIKGPK